MKPGRALLLACCALGLSAAQASPSGKVDRAYAARVRAFAALRADRPERAAAEFDKALALTPRSAQLWVDIARFRLAIGNAGGAIEAADHAASLDPRSPRAALMIAQLARGQYGPVASLPLFDRALSLQPDNLETLGEMAATLGEAGQSTASLGMTRAMLARDRANPRAFFLQAVLAARAGRYALARGLLYRTGGRLDGTPAVDLLRAALELEAGNSEQAVARLGDLVRGRPLHFPARRLLAAAQWRGGDMAGVVQTLMPMARRTDADPYTLTLAGRAEEARGNRAEAALLLDRAAAAAAGEAASFGLEDWAGQDEAGADVAIPRISQLAASGDAAGAIALAAAIRDRNTGSPGAHVALGDTYALAGDPARAAIAYRAAANLDFSEAIALRLVSALHASGQARAAARAASLYLDQNPRSIAALRLAGNAALARRDWRRAGAIFDALRLRVGDRDPGAAINAAWARFAGGETASAAILARRAAGLSGNNAQVLAAAGTIFGKSGDRAAGRRLLGKARALAPGDRTISARLAELARD